jgi:phage terminase large subunit-like protein
VVIVIKIVYNSLLEDCTEILLLIKTIHHAAKIAESSNSLEDVDDSTEIAAISASMALQDLETVHAFLRQQENASEHIKILESILERKRLIRCDKQALINILTNKWITYRNHVNLLYSP